MRFSTKRSVIQCRPLSSMVSHASLDPSELSYRNRPAHWKPPSVRRYGKTVVPRPESRTMRYELTEYEWSTIRPILPNKARGVPRVDDRRVLNGIFWVLGTPPIIAAGLLDQHSGSDLRPWLFPVGSCTQRPIPFPHQRPPSKSRYLSSSLRISAPQAKRSQSPRPHTWPRRQTKQNSNSAHRDAILLLTPFIRIYQRQRGGVYGTVEVAKHRSL